MKMRAVVIGLGQIGMGYDLNCNSSQFVLTHSRAFQTHPAFELVGGVESNIETRTLFESEYSIPAFENIAPAIKECSPEIVIISTPTTNHVQTLLDVLKCTRPRAIICEKPLAYNIRDARTIVDDCKRAGTKLFVNYMRRSDRGVSEVKLRIDDGRIGQPIKGVCWYSKGILNNGSHLLNLLQFWLGDIIFSEVITEGGSESACDPEPDIRIVFRLGTVIMLAVREENYSHYTIEINSSTGRLRYEQGGSRIEWQSVVDDLVCEGYRLLNTVPESILSDMDRIQWHVADQVAAALSGSNAHVCTGQEGLDTLEHLLQLVERY